MTCYLVHRYSTSSLVQSTVHGFIKPMRHYTPRRIIESILSDEDEVRQAISWLAYAGLKNNTIADLAPEHLRHQPPTLPSLSERRGLTYDEARDLIDLVHNEGSLRDTCVIELGLMLGLRQVEMRRLRARDLSEERGGDLYVRVQGKGGGYRTVYVPPPLDEHLRELADDKGGDDPLIQGRGGREVSRNGLRYVIYQYLHEVAPDARGHDLRHTCITWLLNTGATLEQAMEIAGHKSASSHEIYAAADDGWFIESWSETHPISSRVVGPEAGIGYVYVEGAEYDCRMTQGTERVVPLPTWAVSDALGQMGAEGFGLTTQQVTRLFDDVEYGPRELRAACAVHMSQNGAHPFLVSLIMGVTMDFVMKQEYARQGHVGREERREALTRASSPVFEPRLDTAQAAL